MIYVVADASYIDYSVKIIKLFIMSIKDEIDNSRRNTALHKSILQMSKFLWKAKNRTCFFSKPCSESDRQVWCLTDDQIQRQLYTFFVLVCFAIFLLLLPLHQHLNGQNQTCDWNGTQPHSSSNPHQQVTWSERYLQ